jgi:tyrosyl-tRNA synthetase
VIHRLRIFTFLDRARIEELARAVEAEPFRREAQRELAWEVTTLVHGRAATESAIAASQALFGQGELAALDESTLRAALGELPSAEVGTGTTVIQALVDTGLVSSAGEARRAIAQGGVYVNNVAVGDAGAVVDDLLHGRFAVIRRGKKTLAALTIG